MAVILASASPRRSELLAAAGYQFSVSAADVDESPRTGEVPDAYVRRVASAKARRVAGRSARDAVVIGADTTVVLNGEMFGKPAGPRDAARMLGALAGAVHEVLTGVVVIGPGREAAEVVRTRVHVVPLTAHQIEWYVGTGEPEGKAGAYAIQGRAARFVDWIEGSWSNVVGLPVATIARLLGDFGVVS